MPRLSDNILLLDELEDLLQRSGGRKRHVVVGDMNIDVHNAAGSSEVARRYVDFISSYGLAVANRDNPLRQWNTDRPCGD